MNHSASRIGTSLTLLAVTACSAAGNGSNAAPAGTDPAASSVTPSPTVTPTSVTPVTPSGTTPATVTPPAPTNGETTPPVTLPTPVTPGTTSEPTGETTDPGSEPTATDAPTSDDTTTTPTTPPSNGECEPGITETAWADSCPTEGATCTAGEWVAGGPDPDHSAFALKGESEHFAIYSDENLQANQVQDALDTLEDTVWNFFFGAPIYFTEPLCDQTTKNKASIHVHSDWGLTGGAWGQGRMGMWIGSGALADHWGLAHEFTHAVQSVSGGQSCNRENTCGWLYESHANFMAHQLPEYRDEVHCSELLVNAPHLYLGSTRDRYCNWQFMEYLKDKHCYRAVNEIWSGEPTPDPFTGITQSMSWDISQLNDFIGEWAMHNITWDYKDPPPTNGASQGPTYRRSYGAITDRSQAYRRIRTTRVLPLGDELTTRRFYSPDYWAPQRFGYNVIPLHPEAGATSVSVTFRGVPQVEAGAGFRWGLVATDAAIETPRYSSLKAGTDGEVSLCINPGEQVFLVVVATPDELETVVWDQPYATVRRYPYLFEVNGAWPDGFKDGAADDCPSGLTRASNGGGCAPAGTTAYVGPYATVLAGASATGDARIEDHATVVRGTVSGGTVGALTLVGNANTAFDISSGTARTTFYPLGYFEPNQGLAGGTLVGDVEYRGSGLERNSGTCSGFVDQATCVAPGNEVTPLPPYEWP